MKVELDTVHELLGARPRHRLHMLLQPGYAAPVGPMLHWPMGARLEDRVL
jgi:hypothetical protein